MLKHTCFITMVLLMNLPPFAGDGRKIQPVTWKKDYPAAPAPTDTSKWGKHIQRTMTLLATSTPEKRNTVRILFYGQSIVGHKQWTDAVAADLKTRFPHADIIYDNRAIGGFASQFLVGTSESDMYPFYPDLVVFHVYGAHNTYQEIIHTLRSRTTAEVAIVSDHLGKKAYDGKTFAEEDWWGKFMMGTFVPAVAKEYDCQFIDITTPWKTYLESNGLPSSALLKDGIHPNDHGCFLMSELVKRELVYLPDHPRDEWQDLVVEHEPEFRDGKLRLTFTGNRIDLLAAPGDNAAAFDVRIDGKKPSEFPTCYTFTRTSGCPGVAWPAILRVDWQQMRLLEDWTLTIDKIHKPMTDFSFHVEGSKTGPDGSGRSTERFVSNSGRVVIDPQMWHLERDYKFKGKAAKPGFTVTWSVKPLFTDRYDPVKVEDKAKEYAVTLAQNLPNGEHTLELTVVGTAMPRVKTIRSYRPPVTGKMTIVANPPPKN